jgi:hypothetical protein
MTRTDILEAIQRAESAGFHVLARALVELWKSTPGHAAASRILTTREIYHEKP